MMKRENDVVSSAGGAKGSLTAELMSRVVAVRILKAVQIIRCFSSLTLKRPAGL